jgi:nonribosomal peptide synthetase DhbF
VIHPAGVATPAVLAPNRQENAVSAKTMRLSNGLEIFYSSKEDVKSLDEEIFKHDAPSQNGVAIRDGDTIFDLGANIGLFALWAHQKCRTVTIHAFEPILETFNVLKRNVELHSLNVKTHNVGIGGESGTVEFTNYVNMAMISTMRPDEAKLRKILRDGMVDAYFKVLPLPLAVIFFLLPVRKWRVGLADKLLNPLMAKRKVSCKVETLGEVIRRENVTSVDLLKIDTEGNELEILNSLDASDWAKIRQFIIEIHNPETELDTIRKLVEDHGFEVKIDNNVVANEGELYMLYARRPG